LPIRRRPGEFREIKLHFNIGGDIPLFNSRYNIAPTQLAPVIANREGANRVELFQWGLVPSWAKDIPLIHFVSHSSWLATQRKFGYNN
jgi:putative SOS response-associated peptidase YedK